MFDPLGYDGKTLTQIQDEAKAALYLAAKEAADFVKAALQDSKTIDPGDELDKNRLDAALKLLQITFSKSS